MPETYVWTYFQVKPDINICQKTNQARHKFMSGLTYKLMSGAAWQQLGAAWSSLEAAGSSLGAASFKNWGLR